MRKQRKINNFYVFYRISDKGTPNSIKLDYASKINCLKNAINVFRGAKITVYIDNVIEETDKLIHELCDNNTDINIKYLNCSGNSKSFRIMYEDIMKLDENDFVYLLEDDYIHLNGSLDILKEFAERNYTDYVTLYDHPDKYEEGCVEINPYCRNFGEKTIVFRTPNHHWKITNSTTMTFGAFSDVLKRDKDIFWEYTTENIPKDFKLFLKLGGKGILLSSPIPSFSTHCNKGYTAPFIDWEEIINTNNNRHE